MSSTLRRVAAGAVSLLVCAGAALSLTPASTHRQPERSALAGEPDGGNEAADLDKIGAARASIAAAPAHRVTAGAYARGARASARMAAQPRALSEDANPWAPYGAGPLHADDADYAGVNGEGLSALSG